MSDPVVPTEATTTSPSQKTNKKKSKKALLVAAIIVVIIAAAGAAWYATGQMKQDQQAAKVSQKGAITLDTELPLVLKRDNELRGSYKPADGKSLYFVVSSKDEKTVWASGSVATNKDGSFSRNVTLPKEVKATDEAQLKVYSQSTEGKISDSVTLPAKIAP